MGTCSLDNCNYECFEQEDKCILHCEKNEYNNWYTLNKDNVKEWNTNKVVLFWKKINKEIEDASVAKKNNIDISNEMTNEYNYEHFKYKFEKVIFPISLYDSLDYISFYGLNNNININFIECNFLSSPDFRLLNKARNIEFSQCEFFESVKFENIEFYNQFLFESCIVHKNIHFLNIIFKDITSFMNTEFYEELNFMHSMFEDLAIFNVLKGGKLFLGNTFFRKEVNFLSMNIKIHDRETARIIKHSFEKQNNIIEANKFYALEMNEMEKELSILKNPFEWIVFKMHGISSEHSQSPYLALLWILNIAYMFSIYCATSDVINYITSISATIIILLSMIDVKHALKVGLTISYLELLFFTNIKLNTIADKINPFSIMTSWDKIPFDLLVFKITIAYLIYQFIVSVRQNTRRK